MVSPLAGTSEADFDVKQVGAYSTKNFSSI